MSDDFFAPPPFDARVAGERLARDLRALGLVARGGEWLSGALPVVRVAPDTSSQVLTVSLVDRLARSPSWRERRLDDHARLRDFVAAVKRVLAAAADE